MTEATDVQPPGREVPTSVPADPAEHAPTAQEAWESVVDLFERAADEPEVAATIGRIEHVVLLRSLDVPGSGIVLHARGGRLEVRDTADGRDATIELALRTPDLELLGKGRLRVAMAIAQGRAEFGGPVRQLLRVLPLVQAIANPPVPMGTNIEDVVREIA